MSCKLKDLKTYSGEVEDKLHAVEQCSLNKNVHVKCHRTTKLKSRKGRTIQTLWCFIEEHFEFGKCIKKFLKDSYSMLKILRKKIEGMLHTKHENI